MTRVLEIRRLQDQIHHLDAKIHWHKSKIERCREERLELERAIRLLEEREEKGKKC